MKIIYTFNFYYNKSIILVNLAENCLILVAHGISSPKYQAEVLSVPKLSLAKINRTLH